MNLTGITTILAIIVISGGIIAAFSIEEKEKTVVVPVKVEVEVPIEIEPEEELNSKETKTEEIDEEFENPENELKEENQ